MGGQCLSLPGALLRGWTRPSCSPRPDRGRYLRAYLADEHGWLATFVLDEGVREAEQLLLSELNKIVDQPQERWTQTD